MPYDKVRSTIAWLVEYWTWDQDAIIPVQGCHGQGKNSGKRKMFQVREKSGNFIFSQGNLEKMKKVKEKSGNFNNFKKIAS